MDENKLIEKTREVFYKQKELTDLIDDLKDEVKKVYYKNQELTEENKLLKDKISLMGSQTEEVAVSPVFEGQEKTAVQIEAVEQEMQDVEEMHIEGVGLNDYSPELPDSSSIKQDRSRDFRKNAIAEFFLGKNVIAKIAAILIFLGVLTFGQMAYVDWLDDVGRSLLILFTGIVFGLVAWYTEKKKLTVFSNVFYGISLFILFYSILLAGFTFMLFNTLWISILLLALLLATMVYFKDKRYEFLDIVLSIFYLVVGFTFLYCIEEMNIVVASILSVFFVAMIGYNVYTFSSKHYKNSEVMRAIFQIIHLVSILYFVIFVLIQDDLLTSAPVVMIGYSILQVAILYILGISFDFDKYSPFRYMSPILLLISMYVVTHIFNMSILQDRDVSFQLSFLTYAVLLIPIYIHLYKKYKDTSPDVGRIYYYTIGLSYLVFALTAQQLYVSRSLSVSNKLILVGIGAVVAYVVYLFQKDEVQRFLFWKYLIALTLTSVFYVFIYGSINLYDLPVAITVVSVSLVILGVNLILKYWKKMESSIEKELVKLFVVYSFVPLIVVLMMEYVTSDASYLLTVIVFWLIGFRWLSESRHLHTKLQTYFTLTLNVVIVGLTYGLNLIYFDHDFSQFADVFKLAFVVLPNLYIVYSLKEIYVDHLKKLKEEGMFVLVYLIGVLVHSYYIHRYINIEFDKVILSSYFLIASAVGVLIGFRQDWSISRRLGLFAIYYSLLKFFIYDFYAQDFSSFVRMMTYFILGFVLLGISILYAYLERTYKKQ